MTKPARQTFASRPGWVRSLVIVVVIALSIGGFTTLVIKHGMVHWPLRVASGPATTVGYDLINTLGSVVAEERPLVQLKRVKKESLAASAKALEDGEADLAIVRSDIGMPKNGLTIAILRRDNLVLIVPGRSRINSFQALAGKKVGLLKMDSPERNESLSHLLDGILTFHNVSPDMVEREFLAMDDIGPAVAQKQVAGILALGPSGLGSISKAITAIAHATQTSPRLIGEKQAAAIAKTIPGTEANEIDEGAFGGTKPKPEEALNTLAVTVRLVGRHSLPDFATGEIARLLTLSKARLLASSPLARSIEAPDSDDGSNLPIHPGAAAYFEGEQDSLVDSAFTIVYLLSIVCGVIGSGIIWLFSVGKDSARDRPIDHKQLLTIICNARTADLAGLERMEAEIDQVVAQTLAHDSVMNAEQLNAIAMVHQQIDRRRRVLQAPTA